MFSKLLKSTFICFIVCLNCGGCDFIYGLLQRSGAEEKAIVGEILPFTHNEKVQEVQELLDIYGFNPGKLDGLMGPKTREALEAFQRKNGLKLTRFVDKRTWARLNIIKDADLVSDGEINTETVQFILKNAGFDPGKIDGKKGAKTNRALREFQKANGLKADGVIGPATLRKLIEFLPAQ